VPRRGKRYVAPAVVVDGQVQRPGVQVVIPRAKVDAGAPIGTDLDPAKRPR
jgi:hypothetical protein